MPLVTGRAGAVTREAARAGLQPAWVFGLIRAEGAWNPNARSPVGARGLMQLMPATAAAVAKSLGVRADPLTDPAHNIRLGTTYLGRRVTELDGNPVLATGAYNAGIGAVRRWLSARESWPSAETSVANRVRNRPWAAPSRVVRKMTEKAGFMAKAWAQVAKSSRPGVWCGCSGCWPSSLSGLSTRVRSSA